MLTLKEIPRKRKNGQWNPRRFVITTRCSHAKQAANKLRLERYLATGADRRFVSKTKAEDIMNAIREETDYIHAQELLRRPLACVVDQERRRRSNTKFLVLSYPISRQGEQYGLSKPISRTTRSSRAV